MIKYSKSKMQAYLTKKDPVTVYKVKIIAKDGSYCNYNFTYSRYHEERLLKRAERKALKLILIERPDFEICDIKTKVIKNSVTIKSNTVSIPKGCGVTRYDDRYYLYSPVDVRQYKVKTVDISFNPPIIVEKTLAIEGRYRKEREHLKIEKALSKDEKLISFELIARITKKLEHEVTFTWPQDDKI